MLASAGAHTKDPQRARPYLNEGLELAQQLNLLNLVRRCLGALYKLDKADGEFEGALRHLEALQRATRSLENEHAARRSQHLSVRLELEVQHEAALSELRNTQTDLSERNLRLLERLREQTARLQQGATEDPLTGLYNRRYAERQLKREFVRARRYGRPLSVAVVAIDDFGGVESFPHAVGEAVLKTLAKILTASLRPPDVAARYGAEAFVMILPETGAVGGRTVCERVRRAVDSYRWRELHSELKVTLSAGLCSELDPVSAERMLSDAAAKLQRAREGGKNRVV